MYTVVAFDDGGQEITLSMEARRDTMRPRPWMGQQRAGGVGGSEGDELDV